MQVTLFTLLAANAVFATPIYKRQSEVVTQVTSVLSEAVPTQVAATNPISLPINSVTPDISAISTMTGAIESAQPGMEPSAMSSGDGSEDSDSSASASASASGSDVFSLAYPCPDGTQLIYVETQQNVNASLAVVNDAVSYFGNSTLFNVTMSSGAENEAGQTREVSIADVLIPEVLIDFMMDNETDARFLTWNSTETATIMDIEVATYSTQSQSYTNDTLSTDADPVSTIKLFSNICVGTGQSDAAQTFLQNYFTERVQAAATGIELATNGEGVEDPLSSASSMVESGIESATSAVFESASSIVESATSALQSLVSSATEEVASATSSLGESAASATSAVNPSADGALLINTPPSIVQCRPVAITFTGGQAPYFLSILPAGQPTATPLLQFPQQSAASTYTWNANLAAGTAITLQVRDSTGDVNFSSPVTITESDDASCLAVPTSA